MVLDLGATFAKLDPPTRDAVLRARTVWTSNAEEAAPHRGLGMVETAETVATLLSPDAVTIVRDGPQGVRRARGRGMPTRVTHDDRSTPTVRATHTGRTSRGAGVGSVVDQAAARANAEGAIKVTRLGPDTAPDAGRVDALSRRLRSE